MNNFVHLHAHSHYSLLDGLASPMELAKQAKKLGQTALAISDHGNMHGAIEFYLACKDVGIKPIIGFEAYIAPNSRFDKKSKKGDIRYHHITLLAKNEIGYKNLIKLSSFGYTEGFYYRPRIDMEILCKYKEGLIVLSGCQSSQLSKLILLNMDSQPFTYLSQMKAIFSDDFYIEIQDTGTPEQVTLRETLPDLALDLDVPVVATNDIHYIAKEDNTAHDALICIGTGKCIKDEKRLKFSSSEYYMKTYDEMNELWPREYLEESGNIADKCNLEIKMGRQIHIYEPESAFNLLKGECDEKIKDMSPTYQDRYTYEIEVIKRTGYAEYLMVVADFIKFAKDSGIPVGSGRGSSAGSLVCYLLGITKIDPILYGLIFERFINIDRIEPPDIDVDICQGRRQEVFEYLRGKYGTDQVAQIVTFGSMKTKAVIRDVCRVMGVPWEVGDIINKKLGDHWEGTILDAINRPDIYALLADNLDSFETVELLNTAIKIEGRLRHSSTHAAGIVISDKPLIEVTPLYKRAGTNDILTQYDMASVGKLGLLKFDILGLRTLTLIFDACKIAGIHPDDIPLDDKYTYESLRDSKTVGIFQYEGWGYTRFIRRMRPREFDDLIALGALYRPGPLNSGMADDYITNRNSKKWKNEFGSITKDTYGILLYQEQVMQVVVERCGFTMNEADTLRKAIGKKDQDLMDKMLAKIDDKDLADKITTFARYGWNKAHAVSYALLSYQTAWLRTNHPVAFWCATLNSQIDNNKRFPTLLREAEHKDGIKVEPPHINLSSVYFSVHDRQLFAGILAIKGIGKKACERILAERTLNGLFKSAEDFRSRIPAKHINRLAYEILVATNVFRETITQRGVHAVI